MDHSSCPVKCLWERYHADLSAMESMETSIGNVNIGTSRQTRLTAQNDSLVIADGINLVKERLHTLAWRLHHDLSVELSTRTLKQSLNTCCE